MFFYFWFKFIIFILTQFTTIWVHDGFNENDLTITKKQQRSTIYEASVINDSEGEDQIEDQVCQ